MQGAKALTIASLNANVKSVEYAVRGALAIRADEIKDTLAHTPNAFPFKSITNCNIGNPQQLGQHPITFVRQVLSLVEYPVLMDSPSPLFPSDTVARAKLLLNEMNGSSGAYTHSQGIPSIRRSVAGYLERRDGFVCNPGHIFLTTGPGVQLVLQSIIKDKTTGIAIPIPQYPLYTATIALFGGTAVEYFLDEMNGWEMSLVCLQTAVQKARNSGIDVRVLCIINPSNPTGQCLKREEMELVIRFCKEESLLLLADEVYQMNAYDRAIPFQSFRKVLQTMGAEYSDVELISLNSVSKGVFGECGKRGGYFDCLNIDQDVIDVFYKLASVNLCPPVSGQVIVDLMVNPPKTGEPSFELFHKETTDIFGKPLMSRLMVDSLIRRSEKLAAVFNSLEGITCVPATGAMYLFPCIVLPEKAIEQAKRDGLLPDAFYCMELLNSTGVCTVPGSGFGQVEGTFHLRCTFLPNEDQISAFCERIVGFHEEFMRKYRD